MNSLNKIILMVAAVVSLLMLIAVYLLFSGFGDRMMQKSAFSQASIVSKLTFSNMYQLMNLGWKRDQVVAFTESATKSLVGTPLRIEFYRGEVVDKRFGPIAQPMMSEDLAKAMRTGRPLALPTEKGGRYIYPLQAEQRCLACHDNAKVGDVMGAIIVEARYEKFINDARQLLMIILLILAPAPLVAAWLVTLYLDSRFNGFVSQVDGVLELAKSTKAAPNFDAVKPAWSELNEVLDRFKQMSKSG
jgi:hypothetical protein